MKHKGHKFHFISLSLSKRLRTSRSELQSNSNAVSLADSSPNVDEDRIDLDEVEETIAHHHPPNHPQQQ